MLSNGGMASTQCASGTFGIFMALLTIQTRQSTAETMSLYGLCNVPTKAYPFILLFIFMLLGAPILENLAGVLVGIAYHKGWFQRFTPKLQTFQAMDNHPRLARIARAPAFVSTSQTEVSFDAGGGGSSFLPTAVNRRSEDNSQSAQGSASGGSWFSRPANTSEASGGQPESFSGTGHRLGD